MKEYKYALRFSRIAVKECLRSVVVCVVFLLTFFVIQYMCAGLGPYLRVTNDRMNIFEVYIWFNAKRQSHIIYFMGIIFLICSTTFFHSGSSYYLLRANRKTWVFSQFVYLLVISIVYNVVIVLSFVVAYKGAMTLVGEWSEAAYRACQFWTEDIGIVSFIMADAGFLRFNPNSIGILTFLLQVLVGMLVGLILFAFQSKGKLVWGIAFAVILWFGEVFFAEVLNGISILQYVTPFRLATMDQLAITGSGPSVLYAVCYFIIISIFMEIILLKLSKEVDFVKME